MQQPAAQAFAGQTPSVTESLWPPAAQACVTQSGLPQPIVSPPKGSSLTIFTAACCTGMLCAKRFPAAVAPRLGGLRMPLAPGPAATDAAMGTAEATVDRGEGTPSKLDRPSAVQDSITQRAVSSTDGHSTLLKRGDVIVEGTPSLLLVERRSAGRGSLCTASSTQQT